MGEIGGFLNAVHESFNASQLLNSLHDPFIPERLPNLKQVLATGMVSTYGRASESMAKEIQDYTKSRWCDVTSSGTVALVAALEAIGVKGKEVITSNLSFYASANAILLAGGIPYFVDIDLDSLGMDVNRLEDLLKKITVLENGVLFDKESGFEIAAILVPHLFGFLSDIASIKTVASKYQLPIIEDAAEALGVTDSKGKSAGSFSEIGVFSFNGNKVLTAGGGGAIIGNSELYFNEVERYLRGGREGVTEEPEVVGTNGRMPAVNAAFLKDQYDCFPEILLKKQKVHDTYRKILADNNYEFRIKSPNVQKSNFWLNLLEFQSPAQLVTFQNKSDGIISTRRLWRPFSEIELYKKYRFFGSERANHASNYFLSIASSPNLVL